MRAAAASFAAQMTETASAVAGAASAAEGRNVRR